MTIDERFERLAHYEAGLGEQSRRDREESRQLWRVAQREILSVSRKLDALTEHFLRYQQDTDERFREVAERFRDTDERFCQTDQRIQALVSAMGEWMHRDRPGPTA
jgi:hypothetical protein